MTDLLRLLRDHTVRGSCTCGKCVDAPVNPTQPIGHTVDLGFFKVALRGDPTRTRLLEAIRTHEPVFATVDLQDGRPHDFVELGAFVGDQGSALQLMGMCALLGTHRILLLPGHGPVLLPCHASGESTGGKEDACDG